VIGKFIGSLLRDKPTMGNVTKRMNESLDLLLGSDRLAEERWAVKVFQKRPDLRAQLTTLIEQEMEFVLGQPNIYRAFRELLINTIKVSVVNDLLLGEFYDQRHLLCSSISRGMKRAEGKSEGDETYQLLMKRVHLYEGFPESEWGETKVVFESATAEMKLAVLRHLQLFMFERVPGGQRKEWWDLYRNAYELYISAYYESIVDAGETEDGFPHPMFMAMSNEQLIGMENDLLESARKP
jgi:hypothetical protein